MEDLSGLAQQSSLTTRHFLEMFPCSQTGARFHGEFSQTGQVCSTQNLQDLNGTRLGMTSGPLHLTRDDSRRATHLSRPCKAKPRLIGTWPFRFPALPVLLLLEDGGRRATKSVFQVPRNSPRYTYYTVHIELIETCTETPDSFRTDED